MTRIRRTLAAAAVLAATGCGLSAAQIDLSKLPPPSDQKGLSYEKDIRPLFEASCVRCHSGDKPKAGLRLDTLQGVLKGSKEGKVVAPGKSEKSQLVISAARIDPETAMPPTPKPGQFRGGQRPPGGPGGDPPQPGAGAPPPGGPGGKGGPGGFGPPPKPLTPTQVGVIRAWIEQGAK